MLSNRWIVVAHSLCAMMAVPVAGVAQTLVIEAKVAPTTLASFACVTERRFLLRFEVRWTPKEGVKAGDVLRFTFRDLFRGTTISSETPIRQAGDGALTRDMTAADAALAPSSYHVRVDVVRDGVVQNPDASGSCELYVAREGESVAHIIGSFFLSRVAYAWDEQRRLYYRNVPQLPPTYDPFDPKQRPAYEKVIKADLERHSELQHDGGVAFLHGAEVFRRTGEMERAQFCEQVLKRTLETLLDLMMTSDGQLHGMVWEGGKFKATYHSRQEDGFALKLISQTVLYFRDMAKEVEYANRLFERAQPIVKYQFSQPNPLGCGASGCKVYDGRILAGVAYYCLTERAMQGRFDQAHVSTVLEFARLLAEHAVSKSGWYDDGCYSEGKCHIGFGNQNLLCGLLPARRIALALGKEEVAKALEKGIAAAFDFLARTNGQITGALQWIPSRHSQWANGNMHEILDELKGQLGDTETLKWYYANLWRPTPDFWVVYFHRCDVLATVLLECGEYKSASTGK